MIQIKKKQKGGEVTTRIISIKLLINEIDKFKNKLKQYYKDNYSLPIEENEIVLKKIENIGNYLYKRLRNAEELTHPYFTQSHYDNLVIKEINNDELIKRAKSDILALETKDWLPKSGWGDTLGFFQRWALKLSGYIPLDEGLAFFYSEITKQTGATKDEINRIFKDDINSLHESASNNRGYVEKSLIDTMIRNFVYIYQDNIRNSPNGNQAKGEFPENDSLPPPRPTPPTPFTLPSSIPPPTSGGSTKRCSKTNAKVVIGNMSRIVYEGSRGGKYVLMGGKYISLKKALMIKS